MVGHYLPNKIKTCYSTFFTLFQGTKHNLYSVSDSWLGFVITLSPVSVGFHVTIFNTSRFWKQGRKNSSPWNSLYSHETLSTLSSIIWCHIIIINTHKTLMKLHWDWAKAMFSFQNFSRFSVTSNVWYIYEVLNVDEKKLVTQFGRKNTRRIFWA
jgi:hypothetical protein